MRRPRYRRRGAAWHGAGDVPEARRRMDALGTRRAASAPERHGRSGLAAAGMGALPARMRLGRGRERRFQARLRGGSLGPRYGASALRRGRRRLPRPTAIDPRLQRTGRRHSDTGSLPEGRLSTRVAAHRVHSIILAGGRRTLSPREFHSGFEAGNVAEQPRPPTGGVGTVKPAGKGWLSLLCYWRRSLPFSVARSVQSGSAQRVPLI
jgi:hypothetical protein